MFKYIVFSIISVLTFFIKVDNSISIYNGLFIPFAFIFFIFFYKKCDVIKSKWFYILALIFSLVNKKKFRAKRDKYIFAIIISIISLVFNLFLLISLILFSLVK